MRVFHFRISGLTKADIKRLRERSGRSVRTSQGYRVNLVTRFSRFSAGLSGGVRLLLFTALAVGAVYAVSWSAKITRPSVSLEGSIITGKYVVVLVDTSGSMDTEDRKKRLDELLRTLRSRDMSVTRVDVQGFGFGETWQDPAKLTALEVALLNRPETDTVFVFSDFEDKNDQFDQTVQPAYERLSKLFNLDDATLYLGTVLEGSLPPAGLLEIAHDSGGDLIPVGNN